MFLVQKLIVFFWGGITFEPEMLIKDSKDSDFSIVSTKNLSKILSSYDWGLGPDELGQESLNLLYLWYHPQKIP